MPSPGRAARAGAEAAPGLGVGDLRAQDARAVLALDHLGVTARVEDGDGQWSQSPLAGVAEGRVGNPRGLVQAQSGHARCSGALSNSMPPSVVTMSNWSEGTAGCWIGGSPML